MRLWKIAYISVAAEPRDRANASALLICALAELHNARRAITGILTLHRGRYAQVLEGPETALRALMARIAADPRHHSVQVIADGPISARRHAGWSMVYRDPKQFVLDQIDAVLDQLAAMRGTLH